MAQLPVAPQIREVGHPEKLPSGGILVTYEVTKMANSVGYAVRIGYAPEAVGKNLEALVTIGETPFYYNEGVPRVSAQPKLVPPALWEHPGAMYA